MKSIILLIFFLHVSVISGFSSDVLTKDKLEVVLEKLQYIEVSEVPQKASEIQLQLKEIATVLEKKPSVNEMHEAIPSYIQAIDTLLEEEKYQKLSLMDRRELTKLKESWLVYTSQLKEWQKALYNRIKVYDEQRILLNNYSKVWSQTHINANSKDAPKAIEDHITNVIINIETLSNKLNFRTINQQ